MEEKIIAAFLFSFSCSAVLLWATIFFFGKIPNRGEPGRLHKNVSRFGGIALIAAFLFSILFNPHLAWSPQLAGLLSGSLIILFFGAWDDFSPLHWGAQLGLQFILGIVLFVFGMRAWVITNPFGDPLFLYPDSWFLPSFLIGIAFTFLIMNAVNWADGVDGLLGGVAVVAAIAIAVVSLRPEVNQPTVAILSCIVAGIALAFLFFNMPPARILAGTTGAYFIGFAITALSLFAGAKIATTLLVLLVPALDALYVFYARMRDHASPFRGGDGRHLHDKLRRMGFSERNIALLYTALSALSAFVALSFQPSGKILFLGAFAIAFFFVLSRIERLTPTRV